LDFAFVAPDQFTWIWKNHFVRNAIDNGWIMRILVILKSTAIYVLLRKSSAQALRFVMNASAIPKCDLIEKELKASNRGKNDKQVRNTGIDCA
jgi:hypothetical protein